MAGALDVQLAGNAYYFGKLYEEPTNWRRDSGNRDRRYSLCEPPDVCNGDSGRDHLCFVPRCVSVTGHKKEKKNDEARTWR